MSKSEQPENQKEKLKGTIKFAVDAVERKRNSTFEELDSSIPSYASSGTVDEIIKLRRHDPQFKEQPKKEQERQIEEIRSRDLEQKKLKDLEQRGSIEIKHDPKTGLSRKKISQINKEFFPRKPRQPKKSHQKETDQEQKNKELRQACENNEDDKVKHLLEIGAKPEETNTDGENAFDIATENENDETIDVLEEHANDLFSSHAANQTESNLLQKSIFIDKNFKLARFLFQTLNLENIQASLTEENKEKIRELDEKQIKGEEGKLYEMIVSFLDSESKEIPKTSPRPDQQNPLRQSSDLTRS